MEGRKGGREGGREEERRKEIRKTKLKTRLNSDLKYLSLQCLANFLNGLETKMMVFFTFDVFQNTFCLSYFKYVHDKVVRRAQRRFIKCLLNAMCSSYYLILFGPFNPHHNATVAVILMKK